MVFNERNPFTEDHSTPFPPLPTKYLFYLARQLRLLTKCFIPTPPSDKLIKRSPTPQGDIAKRLRSPACHVIISQALLPVTWSSAYPFLWNYLAPLYLFVPYEACIYVKSVCLSAWMSVVWFLHVCLPIGLCLSVCLFVCLICLFDCPSVFLTTLKLNKEGFH